jgi:hypothetical protein
VKIIVCVIVCDCTVVCQKCVKSVLKVTCVSDRHEECKQQVLLLQG